MVDKLDDPFHTMQLQHQSKDDYGTLRHRGEALFDEEANISNYNPPRVIRFRKVQAYFNLVATDSFPTPG